MKIGEFKEQLKEMELGVRKCYVDFLIDKIFSGVSITEIDNFHSGWDYCKPFHEFLKAQNENILFCLTIEMSQLGADLRLAMELTPVLITDDTELTIEDAVIAKPRPTFPTFTTEYIIEDKEN
jgi:hypothetical protein